MATSDEIKIVLNRLENMPATLKVFVGEGYPALNKYELIKHVESGDELGELIVQAHMLYLQSFKKKSRFD